MKYALLIAMLVLFGAGIVSGQSTDEPTENGVGEEAQAESQAVDESTLRFEEPQEGSPEGESEGLTSFGAGDFLRMVLVLGLVILSIYVLFYFLKKAGGHGPRNDRALRVLGTTTLQGSRAVHLIEVGGHVYLVGSADQSVNLISEITDRETVDELLLEHGETNPSAGGRYHRRSFSDLVGEMFRGAIPAQGRPVATQHSHAAGRPQESGQVHHRDGSEDDTGSYAGESGSFAGDSGGRSGERTGDDVESEAASSFLSRQRSRLQHL